MKSIAAVLTLAAAASAQSGFLGGPTPASYPTYNYYNSGVSNPYLYPGQTSPYSTGYNNQCTQYCASFGLSAAGATTVPTTTGYPYGYGAAPSAYNPYQQQTYNPYYQQQVYNPYSYNPYSYNPYVAITPTPTSAGR